MEESETGLARGKKEEGVEEKEWVGEEERGD